MKIWNSTGNNGINTCWRKNIWKANLCFCTWWMTSVCHSQHTGWLVPHCQRGQSLYWHNVHTECWKACTKGLLENASTNLTRLSFGCFSCSSWQKPSNSATLDRECLCIFIFGFLQRRTAGFRLWLVADRVFQKPLFFFLACFGLLSSWNVNLEILSLGPLEKVFPFGLLCNCSASIIPFMPTCLLGSRS